MAESQNRPPPAPPAITWDERLIRFFLPLWVEVLGLLLMFAGVWTVAGVLEVSRPGWANILWQLAGWGIFPIALSVFLLGLHLVLRRFNRTIPLPVRQVIGLEMMVLAALPLSYHYSGATVTSFYQGDGGGLLGYALAAPLLDFLGPLLTVGLYVGVFVWGIVLVIGLSWQSVIDWLLVLSGGFQTLATRLEQGAGSGERGADEREPRSVASEQPRPTPHAPRPTPQVKVLDYADGVLSSLPAGARDSELPSLELLEPGRAESMSQEEIQRKIERVEQTLLDFGLAGKVTEVQHGPAVTQFGVTPGYLERTGSDGEPRQFKVRVSQIAGLQKDLALALEVTRLRIQAPVPGRGIVGIEIPNQAINIVRLRTVVESQAFARVDAPLAVALGLGVSGAPLALNLAKMPHLLIAGTTGSGKSVLLNAFITCLVFNNAPEKVKLIMIDPKKVELIRFNGLPHLLGNVEVEHDRVIGVLRWLLGEMDRRYEAFSVLGAKHLEAYNRKARRRDNLNTMPNIVVFIDELADLMAMYPADIERALCRLAQMARATGIHLVVATQRPSTDVITGLIKANFPARISFSVASSTDSRVILDSVGAEQLLGRGDMLYLSPDASSAQRVQGCFVSDNEIEQVVGFWQERGDPAGQNQAPWENLLARMNIIEQTDDMLEQAIELVQKYENVSASLLQRRLKVGYPRAARLMESLHEMGLVEDPQEGGRTRRTFVSEEDDDPLDTYIAEQEDTDE